MTIPRFTAEAALFQSTKRYDLMTDKTQYSERSSIIPQMRIVSRGCIYECDWFRRCRLNGCYA